MVLAFASGDFAPSLVVTERAVAQQGAQELFFSILPVTGLFE